METTNQSYDVCNIPGEELSELRIYIRYLRHSKDGTVKNTIAWRYSGNRIFFGISRYNPQDRTLEKIQPCKKIGRREAIRKLYEAEKTLYDNRACFVLGTNGVIGSCNTENLNAMRAWFENESFRNWRK